MKKVGIVNYYLSEFHGNNYPNWIAAANEKLGTDYKVTYAWAEEYVSPVDGTNTDQWCEKNGIEKCESIKEVCEKSDVIMILAPSHPQTHLGYAKEVLPFGKPTYIDKTFAPDTETAKEIFALAEKYGTPFFSTSALRYVDEMTTLQGAKDLIVMGDGITFNEYSIHLVEMAVILAKDPVVAARVDCLGQKRIGLVKTESGKKIAFVFALTMPYQLAGELNGNAFASPVNGEFFPRLLEDIVKFFETGVAPFDKAETLEVMRMRELLLKAEEADGEWITF